MLLGLAAVVLLIGGFVMYLIYRLSKQEKMLEVVQRRTEVFPDEMVGLIQHYQQPVLRNVHSMVETRLNDFDAYCRAKYGTAQPYSAPPNNPAPPQHSPPIPAPTVPPPQNEPIPQSSLPPQNDPIPQNSPPLQMNPSPQNNPAGSPYDHPPPLEDEPQPTQPPERPVSDRPIMEQPALERPAVPRPRPLSRVVRQREPPAESGMPSAVAEGLPSLFTSLLSSLSGGGSDGEVTFPVIISDIMRIRSNQQARQQRRQELALPEDPTSSAPDTQ